MPRSYSTAMSDVEAGSSHDFPFLIAGVVIFFLYTSLWRKIKKKEPTTGYVLLATIATLIIIPPIWWYYLTGLALVYLILTLIWDGFLKPKSNDPETQTESSDKITHLETPYKAGAYLCPNCKENTLRYIQGKNGFFWGCNNYPNCTATYDDKNGAPDFPIEEETITTPKTKEQIEEAVIKLALQMTGMTKEEVQSLSVYEDKYDYKDKMVKKWELERAKQTARSYIMNGIK